jgi:hypothetical protein
VSTPSKACLKFTNHGITQHNNKIQQMKINETTPTVINSRCIYLDFRGCSKLRAVEHYVEGMLEVHIIQHRSVACRR